MTYYVSSGTLNSTNSTPIRPIQYSAQTTTQAHHTMTFSILTNATVQDGQHQSYLINNITQQQVFTRLQTEVTRSIEGGLTLTVVACVPCNKYTFVAKADNNNACIINHNNYKALIESEPSLYCC